MMMEFMANPDPKLT